MTPKWMQHAAESFLQFVIDLERIQLSTLEGSFGGEMFARQQPLARRAALILAARYDSFITGCFLGSGKFWSIIWRRWFVC